MKKCTVSVWSRLFWFCLEPEPTQIGPEPPKKVAALQHCSQLKNKFSAIKNSLTKLLKKNLHELNIGVCQINIH